MGTKFNSFAAIACGVVAGNAWSFDIATHTAMTSEAIKQSSISASPNTSQTLKKLGLFDLNFAIGSSYVDIGSLVKRDGTVFESEVMKDVRRAITDIPEAYSIPGWLLRSAVREDDNTKETLPGTPQGDEPGGVFDRVYGHFFDPVNNRGLIVAGVTLGARAPEWATLQGATAGVSSGGRQNYYNWPSAREAMWRALTLKAYDNGTLSDAVEPSNWPLSTKEQLRQAYWATMFRAVGDVVHLVQDMAQPQHTRNDAHSGYGCVAWTGACAGGHASFFENYLRARTLRERGFRLDEGFLTVIAGSGTLQDIVPIQLDYCCYAKPTFAKAEEFFSTATGGGNATGKGIANYSNRGFYSFGTNVSSSASNYPSPPPFGAGLGTVVLDGNDPVEAKKLRDMAGNVLPGAKLSVLTGTVTDSIGGGDEANVKLATRGYWDQFLTGQSATGRYTLNHYNYDDQARLLIPRAVAYSAGLIDYFFRGVLDVTPPDEGVYSLIDHADFSGEGKNATDPVAGLKGFKTIKLKLKNATPDITPSGGGAPVPQTMTAPGGTLVAVLKYYRNLTYTDNLSGELADAAAYQMSRTSVEEIVVSTGVKNAAGSPLTAPIIVTNTAQTFTFEFAQELPINATDVRLQVVYRGTLGSEADAVVVQTVDISEPTYVTYMNARDYIKLGDGALTGNVYTRAEINAMTPAGAALRAQIVPQSCIDSMTDQLIDSDICFRAFPLTFTATWGGGTSTGSATFNLPVTTYHRFAMLVPPGVEAKINQLLSPCLPNSEIKVSGRLVQTNYVVDNGTTIIQRPVTAVQPPVRGVQGGETVACIGRGDGGTSPGTRADLNRMAPLPGANLTPRSAAAFSF